MERKNITLTWDDSLVDHLVREGYSVTYGARNLRRLIQKQVEDQIAEGIIARRGEKLVARSCCRRRTAKSK